MKILNKKEIKNELLSRTEVVAELAFEKITPSKKEVKLFLVKELKIDENLTVIKEIIVGFGGSTASIEFFTYSDEVSKDRIEGLTMHKKIQEKLDEEKKKEEEKLAEEAKKKEEEKAAAEESNKSENKEEASKDAKEE